MWRYFVYGIVNAFLIFAIMRVTNLSEASWGVSVAACIAIGLVLGVVWFLILRKKTTLQKP